jgi:hypothetical protein
VFQQDTAPTGWTKEVSATYNDAALRFQTGTVTTGGADAFSTLFGAGKSTAGFTLTIAEMPSHTHTITTRPGDDPGSLDVESTSSGAPEVSHGTNAQGGGGAHAHTLNNFNLKWADCIIATKD